MQTQEFGMTSKTTPEQEKQKQKNKKKCRDKRAFSKLQLATQRNSNCIYFPSLNNCYQKNEKIKRETIKQTLQWHSAKPHQQGIMPPNCPCTNTVKTPINYF